MIEASWQPDPDDGARLRWWDGSRWTEHVAPGPGGEEVGASPMRTTAGPPVTAGLAPATEEATGPAQAAEHPATEEDTTAGQRTEEDRDARSPVWTAAAATDAGTATPSGSQGDPHPDQVGGAPPTGGAGGEHQPGRTATPADGAAPVWSVAEGTSGRGRAKRSFITARAVHRIVAAIGVVMLSIAAITMISLRSVSGDSVAEAFYNAVGWALLGATIWGACVHAMREIEAERADARDRAGDPRPGGTP